MQFTEPVSPLTPSSRLRGFLLGAFVLGALAGPRTLVPVGGWGVLVFALYYLFAGSYFAHGVQVLFESGMPLAQKRSLWLRLLAYNAPWLGIAAFIPSSLFWVSLLAFLVVNLFAVAPPLQARQRPGLDLLFGASLLLPALSGYAITGGTEANWAIIFGLFLWMCSQILLQDSARILQLEREKSRATAVLLGTRPTQLLALVAVVAATFLLTPYLGTTPLLFINDLSRGYLFGFVYIGLCIVSLVVGNPYARSKNGIPPEERMRRLLSLLPYLNVLVAISTAFWLLEKVR